MPLLLGMLGIYSLKSLIHAKTLILQTLSLYIDSNNNRNTRKANTFY